MQKPNRKLLERNLFLLVVIIEKEINDKKDLAAINPTQQKQARACCRNIFVRFGKNENFRLRKNTKNLLIFEN